MPKFRRLYKFYSAQWALDAVQRRRLKVSTLYTINDPFEVSPFSGKNQRERMALARTRDSLFSNKGLISFSRIWSNPVLWSHYADNHMGVALGFDVNETHCIDIAYTGKRTPIRDFIREDGSIDPEAARLIYRTKFDHWSYENETRLVLLLDGLLDPVTQFYFKDFDQNILLREIILGPRYLTRRACGWHRELEEQGIKIVTARLAFREFAVVQQNAKSRQKTI